ncbi:MAG: ABC transporter permease, partial [Bacillota bacterium]|nr:ABC transporter permease [Bacillota bacterium]
ILIVPILLMLVFYIFMVSQLMVRSETNLISVLESRGTGRTQILTMYTIESLIYGVVTLIIGPILGLWMVRVIGAANGFLEFVNRKALNVALDTQALLYGLVAVALFLLTTLMPVFIQARTSIVQQKRKKSRINQAAFWQRIFLDIILLAVSLYALYRLQAQLSLQKETGIVGTEADLDFLLFLASTLFILGAGLLFLRLYPWLIRLIYFIGRRFWNPVLYASFHQISRSSGQEQFLMIFLILALSIGLFNANAARTINRNTEDSIRCQVGADVMLQEYWQKYDQNGLPITEDSGFGMSLDNSAYSFNQIVKYNEPNFRKYQQLDGVASAARVFRIADSRISKGSARSDSVNLMAIDPYDFARTAWTRSDLYRYHMNEYMNVMMTTPNAVILSGNLREKLNLKVGDGIIYTVNNTDSVDGVIIAFVDYWPGFEPIVIDRSDQLKEQSLIISSLEFMLSKTAIQPYEVWLRRAPDTTDKIIYDAIENNRINVTKIASATQQITAEKNDPQLQGTNGALTLGFIVSMLICAVGFLIYWIMSVQGRVLQFGIFRAMGLGKSAVIGMLVSEQILVSGVAIVVGIMIGSLSSLLFVPLFQLVYSSADQPIPFRIISEASDSRKVFVILGLLLLLCFAVLARLILRIKIDQAVKLGED